MTARFILAALLVCFSPAWADLVKFELDNVFDVRGASPQGHQPWLVAVFDDAAPGLPFGMVQLTMSASGLSGDELVQGGGAGNGWSFNLNPAKEAFLEDLTAVYQSGRKAKTFKPGLPDGCKAGGKGHYDFGFNFGSGAGRLQAGDISVYWLSLSGHGAAGSTVPGLTAGDFDFPGGPGGAYRTAAHVQGILNENSSWIGDTPGSEVPEPDTLMLLGFGVLLLSASGLVKNALLRW